jgi:hypothetical protein
VGAPQAAQLKSSMAKPIGSSSSPRLSDQFAGLRAAPNDPFGRLAQGCNARAARQTQSSMNCVHSEAS